MGGEIQPDGSHPLRLFRAVMFRLGCCYDRGLGRGGEGDVMVSMGPVKWPCFSIGLVAMLAVAACGGGAPPADETGGAPAAVETEEPPTPLVIPVPKPTPTGWTAKEQQQHIDRLREIRHEDLEQVMEALAVEPGSKVADIGCGIGYFSLPLARATGDNGVVYATDFDQRLLDVMAQDLQRPENRSIHNIRPILTEADQVGLEPASVDLAFISHLDFYAFDFVNQHHKKLLQGVFEAIVPGGRCVVLQWMGTDPPNTCAKNVSTNFEALGFEEVKVVPFEEYDSFLFEFTRP